MKKLILLFTVVTFAFTSCSSDDDSSSSDPLIGIWTWHQSFFNGVEQTLDDCDRMDTVTINANGTLTERYFFEIDGVCEPDGTDAATWQNLGNNLYRIIYGAGTSEEEILEQTIMFQGNTVYIEETDGSDSFRIVYKKN